ncbi:MAG: hypothetical protein AAGD11_18010, partial [Planctomycetota bacterium]
DFETSHLQIDNVTSDTVGSRYIVAEIAGWDIRGFDAANQEQIRFGFLDDDSGTGGSRVAAQVQIARVSDSPTDGLALEGNAIGASSVNIPGTAPLALVRTSPFTMVLEFNKLSDTYEVFYKDDSNPSQSLGMGTIAPDRNGNSLRFVVNNNFGSDFSESFTIDRVALTDSNPLTDLLTLEVDRSSGEVKLINTSGSTLSGITGYTIDSAVGSVDNGQLLPFTGTLNAGQEVVLSSVGGAWVQNPSEDWQAALSLSGGGTRSVNVDFIGNTGERFDVGDLNFDGELTVDDWTIFIAGAEANLSALSTALAYQSGDLDGDGINSIGDFGLFEVAFDAANGGGAFAAMLASVPEPSSLLLGGLACLALVDGRKFRSRCR